MLSEMAVRAEALESLLDRAVENGPASTASFAVAAESGRSAIRIALDAIQIHGGYGYIEEYAVARHLRDAMTVSARSGGRRLALAAMAAVELGAPPWRSSVDTSEKT
jgi:alkylation response protein AidB-like acyl-CoA dehydrogenase